EKGRRYKTKEEYLIAQEKKQHNVAVLAMKDRSGNMLFNLICFDKIKKVKIEKILRKKVSTSSTICGEDRKEFKKFRSKNLKSKAVKRELVKDQNDTYNINTVRQHTVRFAKWIDKQFRGVATKYLQSYIMWYIVKHKYLLNKLIEDVGRMLNLAASDRRAWYEYIELRNKPIEILT
ncbi:MAG TPA: transposase, partial [Bacteroidales bacterium]|nr:transposase [Bacteroidales bacterium]